MPISIEDPTTKLGTAAVCWDFLIAGGFLQFDEEAKRFRYVEGFDRKWLYLVGDERPPSIKGEQVTTSEGGGG
jgi:hypothetical protein